MVDQEFSLGALIAEKRKLAGLSRKQLAEKLGYKNLEKGIRRIGEMENGRFIEHITPQIMIILDISEEEREFCRQKDVELLIETKMKLPPFKPLIIRRLMAALYQPIPVPEGMTNEELIDYAINLSIRDHLYLCLQLDYDLRYWINPKGLTFKDKKFMGGPWAKPNIGKLISLLQNEN